MSVRADVDIRVRCVFVDVFGLAGLVIYRGVVP